MSAENQLTVVGMEDGKFWIVDQAIGDTMVEYYGQCGLVKECATYDEVVAELTQLGDPESERYHYTEYGVQLPSLEALKVAPVSYERSQVEVVFDRPCGCVDHRDLTRKAWRVVEHRGNSEIDPDGRVIGSELWYAEALTLANVYAVRQPGSCAVDAPRHFRRFARYNRHRCLGADYDRLCLPKPTGSTSRSPWG